jgi:CHAT domain-containing protein/Flp pilus assembly protein TadD
MQYPVSLLKYSFCCRVYWLWLFLAFIGPTTASGQGLMPVLDPDQYSDFGSSELRSRGPAPSSAFNEAFEHFEQADFESALAAIRKVIAQAQDSKDKLKEAMATDFQGLIFLRQGALDDAIQRHEAAELMLRTQGESAKEAWANATNNLAVAYYLKGDYEEAGKYLGRIIDDPSLSPLVRAKALNNRGLINQELGNLENARTDFLKAADDAGDDKTLRAQVLNNQARIRALQGSFDEAIKRLQEAQKLAQEVRDAALEANILDSWGDTLVRANRAKEALAKLGEAEKIEKQAQAPLIKVTIAWNRGRALAMLGRNDEALAAYGDAIKNSGASKLPALYREALASRADLHVQNGRLKEAIDDYKAAVEVAQTTYKGLSGQPEKDFIKATQGLYEKLVKAFIKRGEPGDTDEALKYLDESKSDALHRELVKTTPELRDKDLAATLHGARGQLEKEAALTLQLEQALATPTSKEVVDKLQSQLADVRKTISVAYAEIMKRYGESFGEYVSVSPLTFGRLKDGLPEGVLLVTFLPTDDALYIFLVSKNSGVEFRQNQTVKRKELEEKIRQYRKLLTTVRGKRSDWRIDSWKDPKWQPLRKATVDLYDAVLRPISDRISSAQSIIFAPTGLLYYLPLHALGPFDPKTGEIRFLIQEKPVSYITSATYLEIVSGATKPIHRTLFALANPSFKQMGLNPLPQAEAEVAAIEKLFGTQALVLKGADATREALLASLAPSESKTSGESIARRGPESVKDSSFGFVHLATHGVLDSRSPKDSWLAMDGTNKLLAQEIPGLNLSDVSLVTLSACETGLAEEKPGGELMNMATFFAEAGAPSIVVTLWSVDDEATRELMVRFYTGLLEQKTLDKSQALQEAQKMLATKPETRHPFFWAPFILIGDWR